MELTGPDYKKEESKARTEAQKAGRLNSNKI